VVLRNHEEGVALQNDLECLGHRLHLCREIGDALRWIQEWRPDLVIAEEGLGPEEPDAGLRLAEHCRAIENQVNGWQGTRALLLIPILDWDRFKRAQQTGAHVIVKGPHFGAAIRYIQTIADNLVTDRILGPVLVGLHRYEGLTLHPNCANCEWVGASVSYGSSQADGFLAPYKVIKVHIDLDVQGYRPERGDTDRDGNEIEDRIYNTKDFDRNIVIDDRTKLVAKKVSDFLKESKDRFQKTILFCVDEEHAARMRQALINENKDLCNENHRYVMRITGSDAEGQAQLGNFIDPEAKYPVLVTTSRLLSTGVDAQTCRLIVLDRAVGSMTEFKQIVGRGTRVHEDTKKFYFTLIDFRGATNHFADPDFDGEPVQIYEPGENDPIAPPDDVPPTDENGNPVAPQPGEDEVIVDQPPDITINTDEEPPRKIYVDGVGATVVAERVEYLDENGKLITESLKDFTKRALKKRFASLDDFLKRWKGAERKQAIIEELENEGLSLEPLADEVGKDLDPFDLICHVAFDQPALTRRERADNVRKRDVFTKYGPRARAVLEALLQKYQDEGVIDLGDPRILQIPPLDTMGTPMQLIKEFGTRADFMFAVQDLQSALYQKEA